MAQLYIGNCYKDLASLMFEIRDEETLIPLPCIDVGDVGKKRGFSTFNNGCKGLKNILQMEATSKDSTQKAISL